MRSNPPFTIPTGPSLTLDTSRFWGGAVQAFALIMAGVFVHLLTVQPEKTAQFGGAATFMVFLVRLPPPVHCFEGLI